MLDKKQRTQRIALRLIGHPSVVIPGGLGAGAITLSLIGVGGGIGAFAGIILALIAVGVLTWRFLFRLKQISQETLDAIHNEIEQTHKERISALRRKLSSDKDRRDETLLDDLQTVHMAFQQDRTWINNVPALTATNVLAQVHQIFETSLVLLDRSFTLRSTARSIKGEGGQALEQASNALLEQVRSGIEELGKILAGVTRLSVQRLTSKTSEQTNLEEGIKELHALLSAAETAEETRRQLMGDDADRYREYLGK